MIEFYAPVSYYTFIPMKRHSCLWLDVLTTSDGLKNSWRTFCSTDENEGKKYQKKD